jgi:hypothetical protein
MSSRFAAAAALIAGVYASAAFAAPPTDPVQVTSALAQCFKDVGAVKVTPRPGSAGGRAWFKVPDAYVDWSYLLHRQGSKKVVLLTAAVPVGLTPETRRATNRCLRPYHGSVASGVDRARGASAPAPAAPRSNKHGRGHGRDPAERIPRSDEAIGRPLRHSGDMRDEGAR